MSTLLELRTRLNEAIGVDDDTETKPWTAAQRNRAISDGYAELYRVGVLKPTSEDLVSASDTWVYALTSIRLLDILELLNSSNRILEQPTGVVEQNGTGWQLRLSSPVTTGYTIRVRGYGAFTSTFASDAAVDDLPAEHVRIPLLKAEAILLRAQLKRRARYGSTSDVPPEMNVTTEQLLGLVAAAEREFSDEVARLSGLRTRVGQTRRGG